MAGLDCVGRCCGRSMYLRTRRVMRVKGDLRSALRVRDEGPVARVSWEAVPDAVGAVAVGEAAAVDDFGGCVGHGVSKTLSHTE
jgi:hypothetical protein